MTQKKTEPLKRMLVILGGKGGTGKTTFIALSHYWLHQFGVNTKSYDADIENPTFYTCHEGKAHPVELLDLLDMSCARKFLEDLYNQPENERPAVISIDMPGASGNSTREMIDRFQLFKAAEMLGYRLTICTVINTEMEPIVSLKQMMGYQSACDYLVVLPDVWAQDGKDYSIWLNSKERKAFQDLNGIEIKMPILDPIAFQGMRAKHLSFFEIDKLPFPDLFTGEAFLDRSRPHLEQAAAYLGLPQQTATEPKPVGNKS